MTQWLINLVGTWGYIAVFVTMTAESAGVPISSEIVVPLGGALASQAKLNFVLVVLTASLANLTGSLIAFYLMLAPAGAALSVDRFIALWWARRHGGGASAGDFLHPEPNMSANLVLRMMQIHFCFIYMASGLSKLQGTSWWTGTAVWGTLTRSPP